MLPGLYNLMEVISFGTTILPRLYNLVEVATKVTYAKIFFMKHSLVAFVLGTFHAENYV